MVNHSGRRLTKSVWKHLYRKLSQVRPKKSRNRDADEKRTQGTKQSLKMKVQQKGKAK